MLILAAFKKLLESAMDGADEWEDLEDIINLRASFLIDKAITGLRMDFDKALSLLKHHNNGLTYKEEQERKLLIAAIDNLVDFAAAEEYQMISSLPDELNEDDIEDYEDICERYNSTYAGQENADVLFSASTAAWWIGVYGQSVITFNTQQDERVRDSHMALEGTSYLKSEFPSELIPPIDWACRCYLSSDGASSYVMDSADNKKSYNKTVNPIFSESLATGGRIFGEKHPYFKIPQKHKSKLRAITDRIKAKLIP